MNFDLFEDKSGESEECKEEGENDLLIENDDFFEERFNVPVVDGSTDVGDFVFDSFENVSGEDVDEKSNVDEETNVSGSFPGKFVNQVNTSLVEVQRSLNAVIRHDIFLGSLSDSSVGIVKCVVRPHKRGEYMRQNFLTESNTLCIFFDRGKLRHKISVVKCVVYMYDKLILYYPQSSMLRLLVDEVYPIGFRSWRDYTDPTMDQVYQVFGWDMPDVLDGLARQSIYLEEQLALMRSQHSDILLKMKAHVKDRTDVDVGKRGKRNGLGDLSEV